MDDDLSISRAAIEATRGKLSGQTRFHTFANNERLVHGEGSPVLEGGRLFYRYTHHSPSYASPSWADPPLTLFGRNLGN